MANNFALKSTMMISSIFELYLCRISISCFIYFWNFSRCHLAGSMYLIIIKFLHLLMYDFYLDHSRNIFYSNAESETINLNENNLTWNDMWLSFGLISFFLGNFSGFSASSKWIPIPYPNSLQKFTHTQKYPNPSKEN